MQLLKTVVLTYHKDAVVSLQFVWVSWIPHPVHRDVMQIQRVLSPSRLCAGARQSHRAEQRRGVKMNSTGGASRVESSGAVKEQRGTHRRE